MKIENFEDVKKYLRLNSELGNLSLEVCKIQWEGSHKPMNNWVKVASLSSCCLVSEIDQEILKILKNNTYFQRCISCNRLFVLGHMYSNKLCHSCASHKLGIVY